MGERWPVTQPCGSQLCTLLCCPPGWQSCAGPQVTLLQPPDDFPLRAVLLVTSNQTVQELAVHWLQRLPEPASLVATMSPRSFVPCAIP